MRSLHQFALILLLHACCSVAHEHNETRPILVLEQTKLPTQARQEKEAQLAHELREVEIHTSTTGTDHTLSGAESSRQPTTSLHHVKASVDGPHGPPWNMPLAQQPPHQADHRQDSGANSSSIQDEPVSRGSGPPTSAKDHEDSSQRLTDAPSASENFTSARMLNDQAALENATVIDTNEPIRDMAPVQKVRNDSSMGDASGLIDLLDKAPVGRTPTKGLVAQSQGRHAPFVRKGDEGGDDTPPPVLSQAPLPAAPTNEDGDTGDGTATESAEPSWIDQHRNQLIIGIVVSVACLIALVAAGFAIWFGYKKYKEKQAEELKRQQDIEKKANEKKEKKKKRHGDREWKPEDVIIDKRKHKPDMDLIASNLDEMGATLKKTRKSKEDTDVDMPIIISTDDIPVRPVFESQRYYGVSQSRRETVPTSKVELRYSEFGKGELDENNKSNEDLEIVEERPCSHRRSSNKFENNDDACSSGHSVRSTTISIISSRERIQSAEREQTRPDKEQQPQPSESMRRVRRD